MVYFLKKKSEALTHFKCYKSFVETQTERKLKALRVDGGGEFINQVFNAYLQDSGIRLEVTAPHSLSQNGIAECLNRTVVEHARAMLHTHELLLFLWKEAVAYATYLKNRSPTCALGETTPEEAFWGRKPDITMVKEFGITCWVLQKDKKRSKLDLKSREFVFTGIGDGTKGWKYYSKASRKILTSRNIIFSTQDKQAAMIDAVATSSPLTLQGEEAKEGEAAKIEKVEEDAPPAQPKPKPMPLPLCEKSARVAEKPKTDYLHLNNLAARSQKLKDNKATFADNHTLIGLEDEPPTVKEAMKHADWPKWKKAMDKEMELLSERETWVLAELPAGQKPIDNKWVFRIKHDGDGNITRYKARLVAKGFSQIPGVDFINTFSPVMRLETLRILLALATSFGLMGFNRLHSDPCVYTRYTTTDVTIVGVHVDDMTVLASSEGTMSKFKEELAKHYKITDLGVARQIVGMEINRSPESGTITIIQE